MDRLESHLNDQVDQSIRFFWHRLRWLAVKKFLPRDRHFRLIDIGAGAGFVGQYLEKDFPLAEYYFVEPIRSLELLLEERYGADRNAKEGTDFSSQDIVTILDVAEHQDDDSGFVSSIASRMEQGALLIATVPAFQALWSDWDEALGHYRRYTKREFMTLLNNNGFMVSRCGYLFPELLLPALWRALRRRGSGSSPSDGNCSEFPELPRLLDEVLFWGGRASLRLHRWWPAGTSVLAAGRRV